MKRHLLQQTHRTARRRRPATAAGVALRAFLAIVATSGVIFAAGPEPIPAPDPTGRSMPLPDAARPGQPPMPPTPSSNPEPIPSIVPEGETYLIDLSSAMRLAETVNPRLGSSRESIREALAIYRGSRVLLLPSLNAGTNYHQHNGVLQTSFGLMRNLTEQSIYVGGGARALAAETVGIPAVQINSHLGDAIYIPLAARQDAGTASASSSATENSVLYDVAAAYLRLKGAEVKLEAWNVSRVQLHEIVKATQSFARVGQGRDGDYKRARTEALFMRSEQQGAQADVYVASSELAMLLRLDPAVRLTTPRSSIEMLDLIDPEAPVEELTMLALRRRPELAAQAASIGAANLRYRQEQTRPLFPYLAIGYSAGGFGGGSDQSALNVNSFFQKFSTRDDFDVSAIWTLQNMGMGNVALVRQRRAARDQLIGGRAVISAAVRREVVQAHAELQAQRRRIDTNARQLAAAEKGAVEEIARTRAGEGLPIESLNSMKLAADARQNAIDAVVQYDIAQFRLFVATGQRPNMSPAAGAAFAEEVVPLPEVLQGEPPRNPLDNPTK